jgi:hypothetical protein
MLSELAIDYFNAFSRSDILRLEKCLSDEVSLHDWSLDANGIESVLNEYANIFESLSDVVVNVVNLYEIEPTVIAELIITAKEIGSIKVVDILTFDENGKIRSIRAYKG